MPEDTDRSLTRGTKIRHVLTGKEYIFCSYPSSLDFPGSRYVYDDEGVIREFMADEIEPVESS